MDGWKIMIMNKLWLMIMINDYDDLLFMIIYLIIYDYKLWLIIMKNYD